MNRHARIKALFHACTELPGDERSAFLELSCVGEEDLQRDLQAMLDFDRQCPDFLARPGQGFETPWKSVQPTLPRYVGRFCVLKKLGEGGMGTVLEAEQDHPSRIVAIKLLHHALRSSEALRRFAGEAEILRRLQHPGIPRILDLGQTMTECGPRQYFVMERVRGRPLSDYVRSEGLSIRGRLKLFARIVDVVQHAHQCGVIHCDLKPQNILVDPSEQPKILDFGIARAHDATFHTCEGQILGTLAYMSPEQAAGDSAIDTRSDIYSLGMILYELLTGELPYKVSGTPIPEAVRIIRERKPSPFTGIRELCGADMETIVSWALEKNKERRYASVGVLTADIRRYLRNEPIAARRPSRLYTL